MAWLDMLDCFEWLGGVVCECPVVPKGCGVCVVMGGGCCVDFCV